MAAGALRLVSLILLAAALAEASAIVAWALLSEPPPLGASMTNRLRLSGYLEAPGFITILYSETCRAGDVESMTLEAPRGALLEVVDLGGNLLCSVLAGPTPEVQLPFSFASVPQEGVIRYTYDYPGLGFRAWIEVRIETILVVDAPAPSELTIVDRVTGSRVELACRGSCEAAVAPSGNYTISLTIDKIPLLLEFRYEYEYIHPRGLSFSGARPSPATIAAASSLAAASLVAWAAGSRRGWWRP